MRVNLQWKAKGGKRKGRQLRIRISLIMGFNVTRS